VWEYAYSFENLIQFMGRLARVQGQTGVCSFITWNDAISQYCKGDKNSNEVARAVRNDSPFDKIVYNTLDTDPALEMPGERAQPQQTLPALRVTVKGVRW
jgi:hypothetical protein